MELIKGNLLFFIAMCSGSAFVFLWQHFDQSRFRKVFIYSRRANRRYEYSLMFKVTAGISVAAFALYCVISYMSNIDGGSWFQLLLKLMFIVLVVLATALMGTSKGAVGKNTILAVILLFGLFGVPLFAIIAIISWNIQLDSYVSAYCIVLSVVDVILLYASLQDWKRGDIV